MTPLPCRFCGAPLTDVFVDLGTSPLANGFVDPARATVAEPFYPLVAYVCGTCYLVQLAELESAEAIFSEYAYFSSYSSTWLEHAERFAGEMTDRLGLGAASTVVEVASNDGYLLQYFDRRGIPVLGIEPARNVAATAIERGIRTEVRFLGRETADELRSEVAADLLVANNVLAHVPDLNDFVAGLELLLAPRGVLSLEFPHLQRLVDELQFDTIYHEHFCYFSLSAAVRVLDAHGLVVFDVAELPTHGGSLRVLARHRGDDSKPRTAAVDELLAREETLGYGRLETYLGFARRVPAEKRRILETLIALKDDGASIAGYGAPAKGNTLLNYCGIGTDFVDFTVDRSPHKQGLLLPGSRIPVRAPEAIAESRPDLVLILPWNLRAEVMEQLSYVREWGGRFLVRMPELRVCP